MVIGKICCLLFLAGSFVFGQEVRLYASVDSSNVLIGDWIEMRVEAESAPDITALSPMLQDSLGPFEVLRIQADPSEVTDGVRRQAWNIRLTTFEPFDGVLPSVTFGYKTAEDSTLRYEATLPVPLTVAGVEVDPQGDIKDIKPPLSPPWAFEDFLSYGIIALVLAALTVGYYYYQRRKRQATEPEEEVPRIPAHEAALMALRTLEDKRLWQQGRVKEYYSEITEIVRTFFEGRLGIVALEMTSDEILRQLKSAPEARAHLNEITSFLLTADLVKFAKHQPIPVEHENELKWAYEIVRSMIPRPTEDEREEVTQNVR